MNAFLKFISRAGVISFLVAITAVFLFSYASKTGVTRKTTTTGCSCHKSANTSIVATIAGPDTVVPGATATYTLRISGGPGTAVATDIAASAGTLAAADANLKLSGGELITNGVKSYTSGSYTYMFKYTVPASEGTQTLYANGMSGSSTSTSYWNFAPNKTVTVKTTVASVQPASGETPNAIRLDQNYPNPFNPSTRITYTLDAQGTVTLAVFDIQGRHVASLASGVRLAGSHEALWNAGAHAAGTYFLRLTVVNGNGARVEKIRKMLLLK